jgi:hypothetical protein
VRKRQEKTKEGDSGCRGRCEVLDACGTLGISPESVLLNLKRLAEFKAAKPFSFQGQIIYSDPVDLPEIQLAATKVLADLLGMKEAEGRDAGPGNTIFIRIKGKDDTE